MCVGRKHDLQAYRNVVCAVWTRVRNVMSRGGSSGHTTQEQGGKTATEITQEGSNDECQVDWLRLAVEKTRRRGIQDVA